MDFVMKIVVSIFVIIAVGGMILSISKNILHKNTEVIDKTLDTKFSNKILEKNSFSESDVDKVIKKCYDEYNYKSSKYLCYILKSNTQIVINHNIKISGINIVSPTKIDTKTLFIYVELNKIYIEE